MKLLLTGLIIGTVAGLIGALCGVGGGLVMVPAFVMVLGMAQKSAVATSLAVIVVSSLSGTLNHMTSEEKLIDWRIVAVTAIGAALASWFGTDLMKTLSAPVLTRIFGVVLVVIGLRMLLVK